MSSWPATLATELTGHRPSVILHCKCTKPGLIEVSFQPTCNTPLDSSLWQPENRKYWSVESANKITSQIVVSDLACNPGFWANRPATLPQSAAETNRRPAVSAWLECVEAENVSFSMSRMCRGRKCQFQHAWNVSWSKTAVSAWLKCVEAENVSFSMSRMCRGRNCQFQHGWNVSLSKTSVSAWLECVEAKNVSYSMSRM